MIQDDYIDDEYFDDDFDEESQTNGRNTAKVSTPQPPAQQVQPAERTLEEVKLVQD